MPEYFILSLYTNWQMQAAPSYCTDANPVMPLCCVVLQVLCACDRHKEGEKEELTEALAAASAVL
jgi:hypothetical protein